jgi:hypothetical protein
MKLSAALILLFAVGAFAQDFADYREFIGLQGPEQFETNIDLSYLPQDLLIVFTKERSLKWELGGVTSFGVREGRLDSVLKDRIVTFSDGSCGGLVFPPDVNTYAVRDATVAAFSGDYAYIYDLNSCAMFLQLYSPSADAVHALSSNLLCKADADGRYIARISDGIPLFFDNITQTESIYAKSEGCYFLQSDGNIDYFDEYMRLYSEAGGPLRSVKTGETGFTAFTQDNFITVTFSEGMLAEYKRTDGICINTEGKGDILCKNDAGSDLFTDSAFNADRVVSTADEYLILKDGVLSAYEKLPAWKRSVYTVFSSPKGCLHDGELIFSDYLLNLRRVSGGVEYRTDSLEMPYPCDFEAVSYEAGVFYYGDESFRFSAPVGVANGGTLYRREADGIVFYAGL